MKEASEKRETISSRGRYERQRESERKHLIMSRRRRTTRSREEEERADEDEHGTTTNSESSSRGDDDPTTTRRGGDDVDEMLLNHNNNNNNNNNAYDVGEEEEDEEEELGYNRFGSVAAGGGGRGRRGRPPLRRNTSDSEEELRRQQQQQRGRGHAPSSEDDDDEELSRSDNDTQMSVDSDTEGRGGLVDSAYNNDLNANTRRRARETHKNYVDAQLANAAGETERAQRRSQRLQQQGWRGASGGGSGGADSLSPSSSSSEEDEGEEILPTQLEPGVFPLDEFNSVVLAHNSYRYMRNYQGYYPTKMLPCLKYINENYLCLYESNDKEREKIRPEEVEAFRKFLSQGILVSNFHTVLEELKASAWPSDSLLFQYNCLEMCCEVAVIASQALNQFCIDRILIEACIDKGDDNVFSMPHKPNESSENNSRTVGLSVNDGEDLEELARACEIEELTAILSALALGMKSSCAFYERYRTHKVPSFSDYRTDNELSWKETEEGKTSHHKDSIAFPVRVEVPVATKGRRRAERAKMDREREKEEEGNENVMTKEIVVKAWPAHVVETFGQQGGWTWLLRLLEARGAVFDNKRDAFTSGEMAKNLMPPRLMESACAALAAATDVLNESNAKILVDTFLYSASKVTEALHALKIESANETTNKKSKKGSAAAENNNNSENSDVAKRREDAIKFASILSHAFITAQFRDGETISTRSVEGKSVFVELQRAIIVASLGVSTFASQLAALKEIKIALDMVDAFVETGIQWLAENEILEHILRPTYLHHRQYVEHVRDVLAKLAQHPNVLKREHLELIWNVGFTADSHQDVSINVCDMLGQLAPVLSDEHLDFVLTRFKTLAVSGSLDGKTLDTLKSIVTNRAVSEAFANTILELLFEASCANETRAVFYLGAEVDEDANPEYAFLFAFYKFTERGAAVLDVMTWIDKLLTHIASFTKEDGGMSYNSNSNNSAVSVTNTDRLVVSARLLRYMFDSNNDFTTSDEIPAKADSLDSTRNVTEMCVSALEHSKALDAQYAASTAVRDDFAWEDARILRSQRRAEEVVTFLHNFYDAAQRTLQLKSGVALRLWDALTDTKVQETDAKRNVWMTKLVDYCSPDAISAILVERLLKTNVETQCDDSLWEVFYPFFVANAMHEKLIEPIGRFKGDGLCSFSSEEDVDDDIYDEIGREKEPKGVKCRRFQEKRQYRFVNEPTVEDKNSDSKNGLAYFFAIITECPNISSACLNTATMRLIRTYLNSNAEKVFLEICAKKLTKTCGPDFQSIETLNERDRLKCARLLRVLDEVLDRTPSSSASGGNDINAESIIPHGRSFRGDPMSITISIGNSGRYRGGENNARAISTHSNETVEDFLNNFASANGVARDSFKAICNGKLLATETREGRARLLSDLNLPNGTGCVQVIPSTSKVQTDRNKVVQELGNTKELPRVMLSKQPMIYEVLFALSRSQSELTTASHGPDGGGGVSKMDIDTADLEEECETVRRAARKLLASLPTDKTVYDEVLGAISSKDSGTSLGKVLHSTFRGSFAKVAYVLETVDALTDSIFASDAAEERSKSYARSFPNVAPVLLDILDDASGGTTTKDGSKDSEIRRSICASVVRLLKPFTLDKNSDTATMTLVGKKHDLVEPVKSMHVSSDTSNECTIEGVTLPKDALRDFAVAATSRVLRCAAAFSKSSVRSEIHIAYESIQLAMEFNRMATLRCTDLSQASVFAELQPKDVLDAVFGSIFCGTADAAFREVLIKTFLFNQKEFYAIINGSGVDQSEEDKENEQTDNGNKSRAQVPLSIITAIQDRLDIAEENVETSLEYFKVRKIFALHMPSKEGNPHILQFLESAFKRDVEWVVQLAMDPRSAASNNASETIQASTTQRLETMAYFAAAVETISVEDAVRLTKAILLRGLFPELETVCRSLCSRRSDPDQEMMETLLLSQDSLQMLAAGKRELSTKFTALFGDQDRRPHAFSVLSSVCKKSADALSLTLSSLYRLHLFDQMDEENREACDLLQFEMEELDALENIEWDVEPTAEVNRQVSIRGHPLPKNVSAKIGLVNAGATCYMNALFQQLFAQPGIRDKILAIDAKVEEEDQSESLFYQTQKMFAMLKGSSVHTYYEPSDLWHAFKDWDGEPVNVREHEDAYVFFTRFQEQIDSHYVNAMKEKLNITSEVEKQAKEEGRELPKFKGAIEEVLGGKMVSQIICKNCPKHRSEREEDFCQIQLAVGGKHKACVDDSMSLLTTGELMDADNQWECPECEKKVDATKRTCVRTLPDSLCLHIQRLEYDYAMDQRNKVKDYYSFPKTLDMYPYTEEALEKADQAALEAEEELGAGGTNDDGGPARPGTPGNLLNHHRHTSRKSMRNLNNNKQNGELDGGDGNENTEDDEKLEYRLSGVIVHSGTAFAGHYYSFIRDRDEKTGELTGDDDDLGTWRRYDDTSVEPYDPKCLEDDCFGGSYVHQTNNVGEEAQTLTYEKPNSAYILFYEKKKKKSKKELNDSHMSDIAEVSAGVVDSNMNPEMALMVEKDNLQATYRANLFEKSYFNFALDQLRTALDLLVNSTSANATEKNGTPVAIGTRKTSRVSQSAVRASSSDADGDGRKQPKDNEDDAESTNLGAKCVRFAFHFYIKVYARASLQLQKDLPNGEEMIEWQEGLGKLVMSSPTARLEFMRIADKYKVDTIAALTRCNREVIREILVKMFTNCLKLTLVSNDSASFERLLEQKKNHDFQLPPGAVTETECPEAFAAYGMIDTYACFFRQYADTEASYQEEKEELERENKFKQRAKLQWERKRNFFINSCHGKQVSAAIFYAMITCQSAAGKNRNVKGGDQLLVHVLIHHMNVVPGLIWRYIGARLSESQTQEIATEKTMLLRLLRRFLEELHFCDSGGPPPSKSKASSFASGDAEPLPEGDDCAKASNEISDTLLSNIEPLADAFVFDNEETAIQILERAQWNSVEFTKKVVGELFRFYTIFSDQNNDETKANYQRANKALFRLMDIDDDLRAQRTALILGSPEMLTEQERKSGEYDGMSILSLFKIDGLVMSNWDTILRMLRAFEGKSGKFTIDVDDAEDVEEISDPDRIVAKYISSAVRGIGLPIWNEQLTRLHDKFGGQSQQFADNVKALYKYFNDRA